MLKIEDMDYTYFIERAKEMQGFKYDNELDAKLGFKASIMTRLRKNKAHLSEDKMMQLAQLANIDTDLSILALNYMRSEGAPKSAYKRLADKVAKMSLVTLAVMALSPSPAAASTGLNLNINETANIHYHII